MDCWSTGCGHAWLNSVQCTGLFRAREHKKNWFILLLFYSFNETQKKCNNKTKAKTKCAWRSFVMCILVFVFINAWSVSSASACSMRKWMKVMSTDDRHRLQLLWQTNIPHIISNFNFEDGNFYLIFFVQFFLIPCS